MKKISLVFIMMLLALTSYSNDLRIKQGFNVKLITQLFANSESLSEFERVLSDLNGINNLDLNDDGFVDDLVITKSLVDGNKRVMISIKQENKVFDKDLGDTYEPLLTFIVKKRGSEYEVFSIVSEIANEANDRFYVVYDKSSPRNMFIHMYSTLYEQISKKYNKFHTSYRNEKKKVVSNEVYTKTKIYKQLTNDIEFNTYTNIPTFR